MRARFSGGLFAQEPIITAENLHRIELYEGDADHAFLFSGCGGDERLLTALLGCYQQAMATEPVPFRYPCDPQNAFDLTVCLQMNPRAVFILDDGTKTQMTFARGLLLITKPSDNNFLTVTDRALGDRLMMKMNEIFRSQRAQTMGRLVVEPEQGEMPIGRSFTIKGDMEGSGDKVMVFLTPAGSLPNEWRGEFYSSIRSTSIDGDIVYPCREALYLGEVAVKYGRYEKTFTISPQLGRRIDGTYGVIEPGKWELVVRSGKIGQPGIVSTSVLNIIPGSRADFPALVVDGKEIVTEIPLEIRGNRIYVPVRVLAEAIGYQVKYEAKHSRIIISQSNGDAIALTAHPDFGSSQFDQEMTLGSLLPARDGRLLAPVRALGEALGCTVHWDENNKVAWINKQEGKGEGQGDR